MIQRKVQLTPDVCHITTASGNNYSKVCIDGRRSCCSYHVLAGLASYMLRTLSNMSYHMRFRYDTHPELIELCAVSWYLFEQSLIIYLDIVCVGRRNRRRVSIHMREIYTTTNLLPLIKSFDSRNLNRKLPWII